MNSLLLSILLALAPPSAVGRGPSLPAQIAFFDAGGSGSTAYVSLESADGLPIVLTDTSGVAWGAVQITVPSATAVGLGWELSQTKPDGTHFLTAASITNIAQSRLKLTLVSGALTFNGSGTADASAGGGNGISAAYPAPSAKNYPLVAGMSYTIEGGKVDTSGSPTAGASPFVSSSPTVASSTSTVIVPAGAIHTSVEIQNNTAANIAISISGAVLTGITAGSGNSCIVVAPGQEWARSGVFPSNAITCYQTSGSSTNAITVVVS